MKTPQSPSPPAPQEGLRTSAQIHTATTSGLTRTQKRLVAELDEITAAAGLDYWNIADGHVDIAYRTTVLQVIVREIVRGEIISQYTLVDERLGSRICSYMFDNRKFMALWKTKKFERFNYYILERMSLMQKLALVKDVYNVPKSISSDIEAINSIRNAVAHAFFPENLREHRKKHRSNTRKLSGPHYKGTDIFSYVGLRRFLDDTGKVVQFFITDVRRKKRSARVELHFEATGEMTAVRRDGF
jgi:hypothetical protein